VTLFTNSAEWVLFLLAMLIALYSFLITNNIQQKLSEKKLNVTKIRANSVTTTNAGNHSEP